MLGGLDWTNTFLGRAFKAQEQVLFFFAAIIFIISATLHLFSIKEHLYNPNQPGGTEGWGWRKATFCPALWQLSIYSSHTSTRTDPWGGAVSAHEDGLSERDVSMDFLNIDLVRCKSDSVLAMPDATIELDPDLGLGSWWAVSVRHRTDFIPGHPGSTRWWNNIGLPQQQPLQVRALTTTYRFASSQWGTYLWSCQNHKRKLCCFWKSNHWSSECRQSTRQSRLRPSDIPVRRRTPSFYRQPSFTFSYHGRVGFQWRRRYGNMAGPIKSSRSLNDIDKIDRLAWGRKLQLSRISASRRNEEVEESEDGDDGTTVKLLWLSMLKMPPQLWRCVYVNCSPGSPWSHKLCSTRTSWARSSLKETQL